MADQDTPFAVIDKASSTNVQFDIRDIYPFVERLLHETAEKGGVLGIVAFGIINVFNLGTQLDIQPGESPEEAVATAIGLFFASVAPQIIRSLRAGGRMQVDPEALKQIESHEAMIESLGNRVDEIENH